MTSKVNMRKRFVVLFFVAVVLLCLSFSTSAANITRTDTITINVTVSEKTLVNIDPNILTFANMEPGNNGSEQAFQIENIGSTNISYIWFNTTHPDDSPFGTGDPIEYDAGNFVVVRKNASGVQLFAVDRWEYNESELIYLTPPSGWESHGRLRLANTEYFWYLINDSAGECNSTSAEFFIGKDPHNQTQQGSVDFSGGCGALTDIAGGDECRSGNPEGVWSDNVNWSWLDVVVGPNGGPFNYSVAIYQDCTTVRFYKWNMDAPGATEGANDYAEYFRNDTAVLAPGANTIGNLNVYVPYGTAAGTVTQGTLTVIAVAIDVTG